MTISEESSYSKDWLKIAGQDWHRIHIMLKEEDMDGACFFLQQSVEKYLKAYLLKKGWRLKKIHALQTLLDEASEFDQSLEQFRSLCERITNFYLTERYPNLGKLDLTMEDIQRELIEARNLINTLFTREILP